VPPNPLPFKIQKQECSEWCWAAVVSSIAAFANSGVQPRQCEVVDSEAFSPHDPNPGCCKASNSCSSNPKSVCNRTCAIGTALQDYNLTQNPAGQVPTPSDFATIKQQIDLCCAVVIQLVDRANPDLAHVMVVTGYSGTDKLFVADPADGSASHTYSYSALLNPHPTGGNYSSWRLAAFFTTVPGQC